MTDPFGIVPEGVSVEVFYGGLGFLLVMFIMGIISNFSTRFNLSRSQRVPQELKD